MIPFFWPKPRRLVALVSLACLCCALFAAAAATSDDAGEISGRAVVLDGDTIRIAGERIRLFGIDAPEKDQICIDAAGQPWLAGRDAAAWLTAQLGNRKVTCSWAERDRFSRAIGTCKMHGRSVNAALVRAGWAIAYLEYSDRYLREQDEARSQKDGIWAGRCDAPAEWRSTK